MYEPQLRRRWDDEDTALSEYSDTIKVFIRINSMFTKNLSGMLQNISAKLLFKQRFIAYFTGIALYNYFHLSQILCTHVYVLTYTELHATLCVMRYAALSCSGQEGCLVSCIIF